MADAKLGKFYKNMSKIISKMKLFYLFSCICDLG